MLSEHYTTGLTGLAFVTGGGLIGAYDKSGRFRFDTGLTEKLLPYSERLLEHHAAAGGEPLRLGIVATNDGSKPWTGPTLLLTDRVVRTLYKGNGGVDTPLTRFQRRNREKSVFQGMDLLLSFRGSQLPHLPFYCPILFDPQCALGELAGEFDPQIIAGHAAEPVVEVFDLLAPLAPEQRRHTVLCEFVSKQRERAICPSLRRPSSLTLLEETPATPAPAVDKASAGSAGRPEIATAGDRRVSRRGAATGVWFQDLFEDLLHDRLFLPSLPDVVSRIRQALDSAPVGIETVARIVETDPAVAVHVVKIANGCDSAPVASCIEAVTRLGVETTRLLMHTSAVQEPLRTGSSLLHTRLAEVFQHSSKVAAICRVLALRTPHLAPEQALLAGLLHQAGELAMIKYLDRQPQFANDADQLQRLIGEMAAEVGEAILRKWHFADALVQTAAQTRDWTRDSGAEADLCDLVIVAKVHSYMGTRQMASVPPMNEIPALAKLGRLDPHQSLGILNQANSRLAQAERLLAG